MLDIYGITFDHTTNYGSCFQAYALQKAIEGMIIENERCEYRLIPILHLSPSRKPDFVQRIKNLFYRLHRIQFRTFEDNNMKFADVNHVKELSLLNNAADGFVCGSDVIWNPDFTGRNGAYYLDFAKKYKFSYAASFGKTELGPEDCEWIKEHLKSFDQISCRERSGVEIVKRCANRSAELVVDPVLLLTENDWNRLIEKRRSDKYIFVYITHKISGLNAFVKVLHNKTGLKVIRSAFAPGQVINQRIIQVQKPEEWLQLMRDAEYVITNSFHATAFSVLFHKKFFTFIRPGREKGINIRMNDFLEELNLGERMVSSVPDNPDLTDIDFTVADRRLESLRRESLHFLQRNLENIYRQKFSTNENG